MQRKDDYYATSESMQGRKTIIIQLDKKRDCIATPTQYAWRIIIDTEGLS